MQFEKIKSLTPEMNEGAEVMLCSKKIHQVDTFIYLDSINSKDGRSSKDVKNRIAETLRKVEK